MTVTTRFAPSPTGRLHVGNIRTALHNWLFAQQHGGRFLLRIDDTDRERSEEHFVDSIRADLGWLGLTPDAEFRQSGRFDLYERRFQELRAAGRVYPAYETAQELDLKRKVQLGRGLPPVYDRAALALTDSDRARLAADGVRPHWRFRLDHDAPVEWDDLIRGPQQFEPATMSDPVIRRADGSWLYMLPSAIDDIALGITHVVRGEDHVSNTALQLQMFAALGATPPAFAHEALLVGAEGKLSKRLGSLGADHFREAGIEPQAIASLLARIGTSDPVEPSVELAPLIAGFDFGHFGRAPARFDDAELAQVNARIVHQLSFAAVSDRLPAGMAAAGWDAIRPNLATVAEAADWWAVVEGPVPVSEEDAGYLAEAARVASDLDWSADPWHALTGALKTATGRKGKELFLPLRRALTGRDHGPDMAALLPLVGRERAVARLTLPAPSYLEPMALLARFNPIRAITDLRRYLAGRPPHELIFLMVAILVTFGIVVLFVVADSDIKKPYKEDIIYVQQWRADRTDVEIKRQQKIDQAIKEKDDAKLAKLREERRMQFQRLDDKLKAMGF